jgi:hypothetical protein
MLPAAAHGLEQPCCLLALTAQLAPLHDDTQQAAWAVGELEQVVPPVQPPFLFLRRRTQLWDKAAWKVLLLQAGRARDGVRVVQAPGSPKVPELGAMLPPKLRGTH